MTKPIDHGSNADGNVYTAGAFDDTGDFDPGPGVYTLTDIAPIYSSFISKMDANGNFLWARQTQSSSIYDGSANTYCLAIDKEKNLLLAGVFFDSVDMDPGPAVHRLRAVGMQSNAFLLKLDSLGNYVWSRAASTFGHAALALDTAGNAYVSGIFIDTAYFGTTRLSLPGYVYQAAYAARYDKDGTFSWAFPIPASSCMGIVVDAANDVWATGSYTYTYDFDPGPDSTVLTNAPWWNRNIYLCRLSPAGSFLWAGQLGGNGNDNCFGIAAYRDYLYLTGSFDSSCTYSLGRGAGTLTVAGHDDIFIAKVNRKQLPTGVVAPAFAPAIIAPNPTNGSVRITWNKLPGTRITVTNILGQQITSSAATATETVIDLSARPNGMYYISVKGNAGQQTFKVLKRD